MSGVGNPGPSAKRKTVGFTPSTSQPDLTLARPAAAAVPGGGGGPSSGVPCGDTASVASAAAGNSTLVVSITGPSSAATLQGIAPSAPSPSSPGRNTRAVVGGGPVPQSTLTASVLNAQAAAAAQSGAPVNIAGSPPKSAPIPISTPNPAAAAARAASKQPSTATTLSTSSQSQSYSSPSSSVWVFPPETPTSGRRRNSNQSAGKQPLAVSTSASGKPKGLTLQQQPQQQQHNQNAQQHLQQGQQQESKQNVSSKEMTKAQRRELQEKQRAAKAAQRAERGLPQKKSTGKDVVVNGGSGQAKRSTVMTMVGLNPTGHQLGGPAANTSASTRGGSAFPGDEQVMLPNPTVPLGLNTLYVPASEKPVALFSHLITEVKQTSLTCVHPCIRSLALKFASYKITGANARCVAMLNAFKKVIAEYRTPVGHTLCRHLPAHLSPQIGFLVGARPMGVGMGNAVRVLKYEISTIGIETSEELAKERILRFIDEYIRDRITYADQVIVESAMEKINDGDVILVYAHSSVVQALLIAAHELRKRFRVIVVDSRPRLEGKSFLRVLAEAGIESSYTLLNAVNYVIKDVTKVILGSHAMLSNGALLSRCGNAIVAMTAKSRRIPVIALCETYKFSERVQLDSFVWNELGNPNDLMSTFVSSDGKEVTPLADWRSIQKLKVLNLVYDVTPSEYIDVVITETGLIPCTSVPVVMREYKPMMKQ